MESISDKKLEQWRQEWFEKACPETIELLKQPTPRLENMVFGREYCQVKYKDGKTYHFDLAERRFKTAYEYTIKQKRLFHRTFSGLQVGFHKKERLIFMTLTTQYDPAKKKEALQRSETEMNNDWQVFNKRLCRNIQHEEFIEWFSDNFPAVDLSTIEGRRIYRERKKMLCMIKNIVCGSTSNFA